MTHLELENLASEYLEGQLAPDRASQVEEHLAGCAECRDLLADLRRVLALCRSAEKQEPAPWLIPRIMAVTVGERKPTLRERMVAFLRPVFQPQVAYGVAMAVFSFSIIINAAGINLRGFRLRDLNPRTWAYQASRNGHLLLGRAEKYYYDLKVVYEIESRLRQIRQEPAKSSDEEQTPKRQLPPGGSTDGASPANPQLALTERPLAVDPGTAVLDSTGANAALVHSGRSTTR